MIDYEGQVAVVDRRGWSGSAGSTPSSWPSAARLLSSMASAAPCAEKAPTRPSPTGVDGDRASWRTRRGLARFGRRPRGGEAIVDAAVEAFGRLDASSAVPACSTASRSTSSPPTTAAQAPSTSRRQLLPRLPAVKVIAKQRYGRFVFISSSAGKFGPPMKRALHGRQDRPDRAVQRNRDRGSGTRNSPNTVLPRLFADGHGDRR